MADETISVPGIGPVKKSTAIAGGIAVAGFAAIMYWRSRQAATTAAPGEAAIDPVTGFPYGSPQDTAALATQAAGVPVTGSGGGDGVPDTSNSGSLPTFANNAEWSQYAQAYLTTQNNLDAGQVGAALGAYLTGSPVTPDQRTIINTAIGEANTPPVNGPGGAPPSIRLQSTDPLPVPPVRYKTVVVPHNIGKNPPSARALIAEWSVRGAPPDLISAALTATVNDIHNAKSRAYYAGHQTWPPGPLAAHVVVKAN